MNKRKKNKNNENSVNEIIEIWREKNDNKKDRIITDALGSYTGSPVDDSVPVQDSDDL